MSKRPDVYKFDIVKIGTFADSGMINDDWVFDGKSDPKSFGIYLSNEWNLIAGYTLDELRDISNKHSGNYLDQKIT